MVYIYDEAHRNVFVIIGRRPEADILKVQGLARRGQAVHAMPPVDITVTYLQEMLLAGKLDISNINPLDHTDYVPVSRIGTGKPT